MFPAVSLTSYLEINRSATTPNSQFLTVSPLHQRVINQLKKCEVSGNVMEILSYDSSRFEEGFAIANDMQNMNFVKLLYSNFNKNLVVVELTLVGESKANNHG